MVAITSVVFSLLFVSAACASPLPTERLQFPHVKPTDLLCQLPIVKKILCPPVGQAALNVQTLVGTARGTTDPSGARRFTVKYASASRWAPSTVASAWNLPNGSTNVTTLPLACPQPDVDSSAYTEDSPTMMWIHGGSFIVGSATGPGLDGSKLAMATNSIVAVVQYRLGALGFMAPGGGTNLAVKDLVNALQFLKKVIPSFGGSTSKITIAGQSSGANMVRALLAVPSASSLFKSAIIQSDPMNYGFLKPTTQQALQSNFNGLINCGPNDTACHGALSLGAILDAQMTLFNTANGIDPSAGLAQPIRPVRDGTFITSALDSTSVFPSVSKPILISSVEHEAGFAIYNQFTSPLPTEAFPLVCDATFGEARTTTIVDSTHYPAAPDARTQLQLVGTDYLWKCSSWTFARNWIAHGGIAYVGVYTVGASYPGNEAVPFCTEAGNVCHQDDIQIVFGTVDNPTPIQSVVITEIQARYEAFLANGNPNVAGISTWTAASTDDVHAIQLGGSGKVLVGACDPGFWGQSVEYDYQIFGI